MWLKNKTLQRMCGGTYWERLGLSLWSRVLMLPIHARKDPQIAKLMVRVRKERRSLLSAFESYLVYSAALSQAHRPGAMAEVGCYEGASTRMICEAKGDKPLHVFDTFEGLPPSTDKDGGVYHKKAQYKCTLESVRGYLEGFPNLHFHPGFFPASAADVPEQQYCFVHLDVDLYESTKTCLEYFYPRMIPGGLILSHDYSMLEGVRTAFTEFLADKPERVIDQPTTQCLLVKL